MVTGDQAAVDEAEKIVPEIEKVPIKWGLAEKEKLCLGCGFCAHECPVDAVTMAVPHSVS